MVAAQELSRRFYRHLAYREAERWRKPFVNPRRFIANRLRRMGAGAAQPGSLRTVRTFHAPCFTVVNGEGVSEEIAAYGIYEPRLTEAFLRLIKRDQIVVDIGMHLGYYTVLFALLVGERGHVHAFEPTPSTRELAAQNVKPFRQVTVHPKAAWSKTEKLEFLDYGLRWMAFNSFTAARMDNFDEPVRKITVDATTLDALRAQVGARIALVKIDAESAEGEILSGAVSLLRQDQPIVTLEVGDFEDRTPSRELIRFFEAQGYRGWEFKQGRFQRHEPRATYTYDNLIFAPEKSDLCAV